MTLRLLACLLVLVSSSIAGELRVGAARVEITPKDGTPLGGYYKFRGSAGVLDPLYAKTIVMEKDGTHAVMVVLDLSGTVRPVVEAALGVRFDDEFRARLAKTMAALVTESEVPS